MVKTRESIRNFNDLILELVEGASKSLLTFKQIAIFIEKLNRSTYSEIRIKYGLSCDNVVSRSLVCTA